ncbi:MAG: thiamine pyrophosphate-binding protein [Ilumatobacter sp.]
MRTDRDAALDPTDPDDSDSHATPRSPGWPHDLFDALREADVRQVSYVPDAGHADLIERCIDDHDVAATVLTTEEEGIAISAGAWLGGMRSAVLMQSSGVGNCINMLSLPVQTRSPLLMIVTMRGEWGEFNPWQVPMGRATEATLAAIGVHVLRVDDGSDVVPTVAQAATMAYDADQQVAVLLGQRLLGAKTW